RLRTARRRSPVDRRPRPTPRGGPPRRAPPDPLGELMNAGVLDIHLTEDDAEAALAADVRAGLTARPKNLPPKWFYDARGSELFEEITRLPEYYPTRTERALLEDWMPQLVSALGIRSLVELGAGSAEKSRIILRAMRATGIGGEYVPIDVSASFL